MRPAKAGAREPELPAPGELGGEALVELVALLDHRAVGVAAPPPGEEARVLPQGGHAGSVDVVVDTGEEVLDVPARELKPRRRRRVEAVDVVDLDRVEALSGAHLDPRVEHAHDGAARGAGRPTAPAGSRSRPGRAPPPGSRPATGSRRAGSPPRPGRGSRRPAGAAACSPATSCGAPAPGPASSGTRRCRRGRRPPRRCARAAPRGRSASPTASDGRCCRDAAAPSTSPGTRRAPGAARPARRTGASSSRPSSTRGPRSGGEPRPSRPVATTLRGRTSCQARPSMR